MPVPRLAPLASVHMVFGCASASSSAWCSCSGGFCQPLATKIGRNVWKYASDGNKTPASGHGQTCTLALGCCPVKRASLCSAHPTVVMQPVVMQPAVCASHVQHLPTVVLERLLYIYICNICSACVVAPCIHSLHVKQPAAQPATKVCLVQGFGCRARPVDKISSCFWYLT